VIRKPGDDPVPPREVACLGRCTERRLGEHGAPLGDLALQRGVFGGIGNVKTARDRRDGVAGLQGPEMGGGVDTTRQAGDHHQRPRQFGGQRFRHPLAVGRGIAPAYQRDRTLRQQRAVADDADGRGRVVQQRQQRGVLGIAGKYDPPAEPVERMNLAFGIVRRGDGRRRRAAAGARQLG
jgi:hypothetical protein